MKAWIRILAASSGLGHDNEKFQHFQLCQCMYVCNSLSWIWLIHSVVQQFKCVHALVPSGDLPSAEYKSIAMDSSSFMFLSLSAVRCLVPPLVFVQTCFTYYHHASVID